MSMIFVTHDLGVAAQIADKVAVMYAGRIVEYGNVHDVLMNPQHPYTRGMLSSTVKDQARDKPLEAIHGSPPDLRALPPGCSFAPRCRFAVPSCLVAVPEPVADREGHMARCVRVGVENADLRLDDRALAPT
jgi:peptide/nickel transport system ATP-binding protein